MVAIPTDVTNRYQRNSVCPFTLGVALVRYWILLVGPNLAPQALEPRLRRNCENLRLRIGFGTCDKSSRPLHWLRNAASDLKLECGVSNDAKHNTTIASPTYRTPSLCMLRREREIERERERDPDGERERTRERERGRAREREREREREQERERERDPDDGAMELRSAAMLFFFSHTLQIVSPRVHGVKASGFKWI
jgi:hypothetical protein